MQVISWNIYDETDVKFNSTLRTYIQHTPLRIKFTTYRVQVRTRDGTEGKLQIWFGTSICLVSKDLFDKLYIQEKLC